MKLVQRFFVGLGVAALLAFAVTSSNAQIWSHYDMRINNQFFNPLPVGTAVNPFAFRTFSNVVDLDDGVANDIPAGFTFDYNGNLYSSVNICVNGWLTVGQRTTPVITNDKYFLFLPNDPNNTVAPFFGDHYYRSSVDVPLGFKLSKVWYTTSSVFDPNPNALPGSFLHVFTIEWKDLNINDKTNPNSIATFQVKFIENALANDRFVPDKRATIEFHYGPIGNNGNVKTQGCTVGIEDSLGYSFMNGLFPSSFAGEDSARLNRDSLTTCWPPASCLPGRVISFVPEGIGSLSQWGDGDANLTQLTSSDPVIVFNQNRFVTLADADTILGSIAQAYPPLDSVEGRNAFHGDANHSGRYQIPAFLPYYFYRVTAYDAAYILMYLAAKIPFLPWLQVVPPYKEVAGSIDNSIVGLSIDTKQAVMTDRTIRIPMVLRGSVNGPIGIELNVNAANPSVLQFTGTEARTGMMYGNAKTGKVSFAASGVFKDGDILGYLEFVSADRNNVSEIEINNISINDQAYPAQHSTIDLGVSTNGDVSGFAVLSVTPNPFSVSADAQTTIKFTTNDAKEISMKIYDLLGKEIRTVGAQTFSAGSHAIQWDGHSNSGAVVPAGVYYYNLSAGNSVLVGKINLMQ